MNCDKERNAIDNIEQFALTTSDHVSNLCEKQKEALTNLLAAAKDMIKTSTELDDAYHEKWMNLSSAIKKMKSKDVEGLGNTLAGIQSKASRTEASDATASDVYPDEHLALKSNFPQINSNIKLNVGGVRFMTTLATLRRCEHSFFGRAFSGTSEIIQDDDGCYFIDRDGTHFRHILNFLRSPESFFEYKCHLNFEIIAELRIEAAHYGILHDMFPAETNAEENIIMASSSATYSTPSNSSAHISGDDCCGSDTGESGTGESGSGQSCTEESVSGESGTGESVSGEIGTGESVSGESGNGVNAAMHMSNSSFDADICESVVIRKPEDCVGDVERKAHVSSRLRRRSSPNSDFPSDQHANSLRGSTCHPNRVSSSGCTSHAQVHMTKAAIDDKCQEKSPPGRTKQLSMKQSPPKKKIKSEAFFINLGTNRLESGDVPPSSKRVGAHCTVIESL